MDNKECKTEKSATTHSKKVAKEKALNGRVSVRIMPKSKRERAKLQKEHQQVLIRLNCRRQTNESF